MMNGVAVHAAMLLLFLVVSNVHVTAFTPSNTSSTRCRVMMYHCDGHEPTLTGRDRRSRFDSYAPFGDDGRVGFYGEIGRSDGRTHPCNDDESSITAKLPASGSSSSSAVTAMAAPPPKRYGIGSWKKSSDSPSSSISTSLTLHRRTIVAGNWKLNPSTRGEAITLLKLLAANFINHRNDNNNHGLSSSTLPEVVIFPPLPYLSDAVAILSGSGIQVGAQTAGPNEKGAYTGEIAPNMLASSGVSHILLGHSERRTLFGESNEYINAVLRKCLEIPSVKLILCIGESLIEYESGLLESVIDEQLRGCLANVDAKILLSDRIILAYEPVWAIGTGLTATPSQAQYAHEVIRASLAKYYGSEEVASSVRIQYGGSVTPESMEALMSEKDVDGALVGGASLNADSFTRIYDGAVLVAEANKKKAS